MHKDPKLKRATRRVAQLLERSGFRVSFCGGILSEAFDITTDSIYSLNKDVGAYIKIAIDKIPKEQLNLILGYATYKKKELWILRHGKSSSDPGFFLVYRIDDKKIVENPRGWPIQKVMSSPKKRQPNLQKKEASLVKTKS